MIPNIPFRSTKGVPRLLRADRRMIGIPDDVRDVLVGLLLGTAHIAKRSPTGNARLVYTQTALAQLEYFNYVYGIFKYFCT